MKNYLNINKFELNETCAVENNKRRFPLIKIPKSNSDHASIALVILDKTANYYHGLYYNIPKNTEVIHLDGTQTLNYVPSDHKEFYSVPCPPADSGVHEYYFKIYYLNRFARTGEIIDKSSFINFIKNNTGDKKSFVKTFEFPKSQH